MKKIFTKGSLLACTMVLALSVIFSGCSSEEPLAPTTASAPSVDVELNEAVDSMDLGKGLRVASVGKYAGVYLEDGSHDPVSDILMVVLKNENSQDLQVARFTLAFGDITAEFEATNLPAGESLVVLEKNRLPYVEADCDKATLNNVAFFTDPMSLHKEQVEVTGIKGSLSVKNLTDAPLGEIYIYYKSTAPDVLYGGITYRAKVDAGLEPQAMASIMSSHYNPDNTRIVNVQIISESVD